MKRRALFAFGVLLVLLSVAATLDTAYTIVRVGFVAVRSTSWPQTAARIAVILTAVYLWRLSRDWIERFTLVCWIIAAGSSALHYGLGINTTALQAVRLFSHLAAYFLSAIVVSRRLLTVEQYSAKRSARS